jgi:hypothetical protein
MNASIRLRFSRVASPTLRERWHQVRSWQLPIDYGLAICALTHSPFSHLDLVLEDGSLLGASDNPEAPVIRGNPRGVAIRPYDYQRFAIRQDAVINTTLETKVKFTDFCTAQIGRPFDTSALKLGIFLSTEFANRDWRDDKQWYCAELMGRAAEVSCLLGYFYPGIKNRMTAADLLIWLSAKIDFDEFIKPWEFVPPVKKEDLHLAPL